MRRVSTLMLCALVALSCSDEESGGLLVDLRTDYVAGREFASVRTSLFSALPEAGESPLAERDRTALFGEDFVGGQRVAELTFVGAGSAVLRTELLRGDASVVASRVSRVAISGANTGVTVLISRDCSGVLCPGSGAPEATECFGGRCVSPECVEESVAACGPPLCTTDSECPVSVPCARGRCVAGACLAEGVASLCGADEFCEPTVGCLPTDMMDGGLDAAVDAALDAAPDASDTGPLLGVRGDPCTSAAECEMDLSCAPRGGVSTCEPLCTMSGECGGGTCREGTPIGPVGICTSVCDPVDQTGCPPGQFCHFFISFLQENTDMVPATTCGADVGQAVGSPCGGAGGGACGPGQFCINDVCSALCRLPDTCPGALICRTLVAPFLLRGEDMMFCL